MKITIAGYGYVGRAHNELLKSKHKITIYDPFKGYNDIGEPDGVLIAVATPQRNDGSCHMDNVVDVIKKCPNVPILIKSTISLEGWDMLIDAFPNHNICFSPEFLREATWLEDILGVKKLLIGGKETNFWASVFKLDTEIADPKELIAAKYFRNSFLATKVAFFNQMYDFCEKLGIEYKAVEYYTSLDNRIGNSHTTVPGHDGKRGFGGHCFPKDTNAVIKTAEREGIELSLINEAVNYNNKIRK